MCGRFSRYRPLSTWCELLGIAPNDLFADDPDGNRPRYNIAPSAWLAAVTGETRKGTPPTMQALYWGFIPSWANTPSRAPINARSETVATKPFFRKAFHVRRCVLFADCWFEWQRGPNGKQPYVIRPADGQPFFFAGLWSVARNLPEQHPTSGHPTATILTTQADVSIANIHHRMPVALTTTGAKSWLDPGTDSSQLQHRLVNWRHTQFEAWPVSTKVNRPANDDPKLLDRVVKKKPRSAGL